MALGVEGKRIWKVSAMALVFLLALSIGHAMSGLSVLPRGSFLVMFGMGSTSATLPYGSTAVLSPVFADGTGVIKNGGNTTVVASAESGSTYPVGPLTSGQTYTLTVSNTASDFVTATVTVTITPPSVAAISPADPTVTVGNTKAFSSSVSGAVNAGITWSVDGVTGGNGTVGTISAGGLYTAPASPGSHTIRATAQADGSTYASTTVTVVAAPVASGLVATKGTLTTGGSTTVTPSFSGGTGKIGTSGAGSSDLAASATSGSGVSTGNLAGSRTYTLTVTNAAGDTATASCTVTVVAAANISAFGASPSSITVGGSGTLSWTTTGATSASINNGVGGVGTNSSTSVSPGSTTTYVLTATNAAGDSVTANATVVVYAAPSIASFVASPSTIPTGNGSTLSYTFAAPSGGAKIGTSAGASDISASVVSGGTTNVGPNATTTYYLTVWNGTPTSVSATATVTVQPIAISAITPANPTIACNGSVTFSATVTGHANTAVNWSASGGTITSSGLFYANPGTYTVTATAAANGVTSSTTTVTVADPGFNTNEGGGTFLHAAATLDLNADQPMSTRSGWTRRSRFRGPVSSPSILVENITQLTTSAQSFWANDAVLDNNSDYYATVLDVSGKCNFIKVTKSGGNGGLVSYSPSPGNTYNGRGNVFDLNQGTFTSLMLTPGKVAFSDTEKYHIMFRDMTTAIDGGADSTALGMVPTGVLSGKIEILFMGANGTQGNSFEVQWIDPLTLGIVGQVRDEGSQIDDEYWAARLFALNYGASPIQYYTNGYGATSGGIPLDSVYPISPGIPWNSYIAGSWGLTVGDSNSSDFAILNSTDYIRVVNSMAVNLERRIGGTNALVWNKTFGSADGMGSMTNAPIVDSNQNVFVLGMSNLYCVDSAGNLLWSRGVPGCTSRGGLAIDREGGIWSLWADSSNVVHVVRMK